MVIVRRGTRGKIMLRVNDALRTPDNQGKNINAQSQYLVWIRTAFLRQQWLL